MLQVAFIQQLNRLHSLSKLCLEQSMLSIKRIFAFYQRYLCLLSNVNMITIKYILSQEKPYIRVSIIPKRYTNVGL